MPKATAPHKNYVEQQRLIEHHFGNPWQAILVSSFVCDLWQHENIRSDNRTILKTYDSWQAELEMGQTSWASGTLASGETQSQRIFSNSAISHRDVCVSCDLKAFVYWLICRLPVILEPIVCRSILTRTKTVPGVTETTPTKLFMDLLLVVMALLQLMLSPCTWHGNWTRKLASCVAVELATPPKTEGIKGGRWGRTGGV